MKKLSCIIICLILTFSPSMYTFADTSVENVFFYSNNIPSEVTDFAEQNMGSFLSLALNDEKTITENTGYKLGQGINSYTANDKDIVNNDIYYFPISKGRKVEFVLAVGLNDDGSCSATFGKMFSDKINLIHNRGSKNAYYLIVKNGTLFASNNKTKEMLVTTQQDKLSPKIETSSLDSLNINKVEDIQQNDIDVIPVENILRTVITASNKTLGVPIVLQGDKPWCWAASMASILNYVGARSLTAYDVTVVGLWPGGADFSKITFTWKRFGYNGLKLAALSDSKVINTINANKPIQFIGKGPQNTYHAVVIDGYGISASAGTTYRMMDSNYSSYTYSSTGKTPTATYVITGGDKFYWVASYMPNK